MTGADPDTRLDGRAARSARTRAAIVEALLDLNEDGELKPTAARIAERAGVSLRALWANFADMETLFAAAGKRIAQRQRAEQRAIPADLPLHVRVARYCEQRSRMLEIVAPAARAARLREPFSPQLMRNRLDSRDRSRRELVAVFGHDLAAAGRGADRLLDALVMVSAWPAWAVLRDDLELDVAQARDCLTRTVMALLAAAIGAGPGLTPERPTSP